MKLQSLTASKGTLALGAICIAVMASLTLFFPGFPHSKAFYQTELWHYLIMTPSEFKENPLYAVSIVTSMFVHRSWWLLAADLAFLLVIGGALERAIGRKKIILLFLAGGVAGGLTAIFLAGAAAFATTGEVGSSPAVYAIVGAFVSLWIGPSARSGLKSDGFALVALLLSGYLLVKLGMTIVDSLTMTLFEDSIYAHLGGLGFGLAFGTAACWFLPCKQSD